MLYGILTIHEILELLKKNDIETIQKKCFYYWLDEDINLKNNAIFLAKKLKSLLPSDKIDVNKTTILFKNNCSAFCGLYDDIRIVDIELDKVIYTIVPSSKIDDGQAVLWDLTKNKEQATICGTWKDIKNYFKN